MSDFSTADNTTSQSAANTLQNTASNVNAGVQNAKASAIDNASSAYTAVAQHPLTQNIKDTVANGPVAENAKEQAVKTQEEFSNLANSRTTPAQPAVTGQQLTHYHSFFSTLLSWDNPRASAIAYASIVVFIFGARYLNLLRYAFKATWVTLGITVAAEIAGQALFSAGFTSQIRPKKYYVLPKETLDSLFGDVYELINFFVIEAQRVLFAENIFASAAVCVGAFLSYYLVKIVPFWGLSLITTSVLFLTPLIYKTNQELIDHHINNATNILNQQTNQVKDIASHHASVAAQTTKQYVGDYSAKAQDLIGGRARSTSPTAIKPLKSAESTDSAFNKSTDSAFNNPSKSAFNPSNTAAPSYKSSDFPIAPKQEFKTTPEASFPTAPSVGSTASNLRGENEPLIA